MGLFRGQDVRKGEKARRSGTIFPEKDSITWFLPIMRKNEKKQAPELETRVILFKDE